MTECNCRICQRHREWRNALCPRDAVASYAYDQMCQVIEAAETDLSWYRAIFDGSWPQAEMILERQLAHVRASTSAKACIE